MIIKNSRVQVALPLLWMLACCRAKDQAIPPFNMDPEDFTAHVSRLMDVSGVEDMKVYTTITTRVSHGMFYSGGRYRGI